VKFTLIEAALILSLIGLEYISYLVIPDQNDDGYQLRDTFGSFSLGAGNLATNVLWRGVTFEMFLIAYRITPLRIGESGWAWVALFVLNDLNSYWEHRANHTVQILWASHLNHHSSQRFNLSTALRQTWTGELAAPLNLPLILVGFSPTMVFTMFIISNLYQFPIHTKRIGKLWKPVELIMNTPSHHRVHHGSNPEYIDKNFGGIFIIWDRLFGTFAPEVAPVVYGIGRNVDTYNTLNLAFHEYVSMVKDLREARSLRVRLGLVFRSPGWVATARKAMPESEVAGSLAGVV
jgi:sterol desaturase/sphingolipid hydroxylase (fatty acid hydroxylase superfamily)